MTPREVIKNFMAALCKTTLSGTAALDEAVQSCSNFAGIQNVIDKMKTDIAAADSPQDFLQKYCGIDPASDNFSAGAPENMRRKIFCADSFKVDNSNLTIQLSLFSANNELQEILSFDDLSDAQKHIWQNLRYWAENSISLVKEIYGENFGFGSCSLMSPKTIYFGFYDSAESNLAKSGAWLDDEGKTSKALMLQINMHFFGNIDAENSHGAQIDATLAHEFTHCAMAANINYFDYLPQFIKEGAAEYTCGGKDISASGILPLADKSALRDSGGEKSLLDCALDLNNVDTGEARAYIGGYMFLCYFARQVALMHSIEFANEHVTIFGGEYVESFIQYSAYTGSFIQYDSGGGADKIFNIGTSYVIIHGGAGDDKIFSYRSRRAKVPIGVKFTEFH